MVLTNHHLLNGQMVPEETEAVTFILPSLVSGHRLGQWCPSFPQNCHFEAGTVKCTLEELGGVILFAQGPFLSFYISIHSGNEPCCVGSPKTDGSWWRALTKRDPLEKGMANHFGNLALRTPSTV